MFFKFRHNIVEIPQMFVKCCCFLGEPYDRVYCEDLGESFPMSSSSLKSASFRQVVRRYSFLRASLLLRDDVSLRPSGL